MGNQEIIYKLVDGVIYSLMSIESQTLARLYLETGKLFHARSLAK